MRRILLQNVMPGMKLAKTLYNADGMVLLYEGLELREMYIGRLQALEVSYVYILDEMAETIDVPDVVSEQTRTEAVMSAKAIMEQVKRGKDVDASKAKKVANTLVDELYKNRGAMVHFLDMRTRSDYLFSHSVNVCILSIMTGIGLGYDELKLRDLGVGALLHDIGKLYLSPEILKRADRLEAQDLEEMRKHCELGFDVLRKNPLVSLLSAHCALQHHERFDGSGYPRKLQNSEIHEYAQIVGLADVYDTFTSTKTLPTIEAVAIIRKVAGVYFDPSIVDCFASNIATYPLGAIVKLNTNQIGVVTAVSKEFQSKPVVRVLLDENKQKIEIPFEIDLSTTITIFITNIVEQP